MAALQKIIAEQPFFKDFDPSYLPFLADCARQVHYEPGHYILREEEPAQNFYLIQQGSVALGTFVVGRGFTTIQSLGKGELLGWSWLIPPYHWHFNAMVVQNTTAIEFDGQPIRQKCQEDHHFGYELLRRVALTIGDRLRATRMRLSP